MIRADSIDDHTSDLRNMHMRAWERFQGKIYHLYPTAKNFDVPFSWVLSNALKESTHVTSDYAILGGTPTIEGTRIPVYTILQAIEHHGDLQGALKAYPHLSMDQVRDAVLFASSVVECSVDGD